MSTSIATLEKKFLKELGKICELSPMAVCTINRNVITIGIKPEQGSYYEKGGFKMEFASEVDLFCKVKIYDNNFTDNKINFCSSGEFDANYKSSYWRTVHAASILKNWVKVCELVNMYCLIMSQTEIKNRIEEINVSITEFVKKWNLRY